LGGVLKTLRVVSFARKACRQQLAKRCRHPTCYPLQAYFTRNFLQRIIELFVTLLGECIAQMSGEVEVMVKWQGDEYSLNMSQDQTVGDMKRRLAGVVSSGVELLCYSLKLSEPLFCLCT
jgi:hypothetical protein